MAALTPSPSQGTWQVNVVAYQQHQQGYTDYIFVFVSPWDVETQVARRYSVLREIYVQLVRLYPKRTESIGEPFPAKSILGGLSVIKQRVIGLEKFFQAAFKDNVLAESILLREAFGITNNLVWYETLSACPVCSFVDMVGINWIRGKLVESMLDRFCKSAAFFHRLARRQLYCRSAETGITGYLGSAATSMQKTKACIKNTRTKCTILDINLFEGGDLISDARIDSICASVLDSTLILKVMTKLSTEVELINQKLHKIVGLAKGHAIIAEMPHDRLIQLSRTEKSVLLKRQVTPAITYFLRKGEESRCHQELVQAISELSRIQGIDVHVYLHLERPFPDLAAILRTLRKHDDTVRVIRLCLSRPRAEVLKAAQIHSSTMSLPFSSPAIKSGAWPTVDFYELLEHIEKCTSGELGPADFVSQSGGTLLEPMLPKLGYSKFKFRPCDTAGAIALLVHSEEVGNVSANRLVNLEGLIDYMQQINEKMSGHAMYSLVKKAFKQTLRQDAIRSMPSLAGLASDAIKISSSSPPKNLQRSQLLAVQRDIDLAALDIEHVLSPVEYTNAVESLLGSL